MKKEEQQKEIDLMSYWKIIKKRKWTVVIFCGTLVFFTGIFSFLTTPKYRSSVRLLVEEGSSRMLSIDDTFGYQTPVIRDLRFFNTQLELLKSKSLAESVVRNLNLLSRPDIVNGKTNRSLVSKVKNVVTLKWLFSRNGADEDENSAVQRNPYSALADSLRLSIEIVPVRDTKLVDMRFISASPILSAEIVNAFAEEFINSSVERLFQRTIQASDFLSSQISQLRLDIAEKERELQRYGQEKEMSFLSDTESMAVNALADLNNAYTQARIERIKIENEYRQVKDLSIDSLPQMLDNPTIQQLKTDYIQKKSAYEVKRRDLKPDHPEMQRLMAGLNRAEGDLRNAIKAMESEFNAALQNELALLRSLNGQRQEVAKFKSSEIQYNSLKIEVDNLTRQMDALMEKQASTSVSEDLKSVNVSNVSIVDRGEVPLQAFSPKKGRNILLALFFGLAGGVGLCILLDFLDNTFKDSEEIEKISGIAAFGVIPLHIQSSDRGKNKLDSGDGVNAKERVQPTSPQAMFKNIELLNHLSPSNNIAEDYRTIRTSILLSHADKPPRTILLTSALPQEGKTVTTANLAVSFSQLDEKVLVIDADLRKPRIHQVFQLENIGGLSTFLSGRSDLKDVIKMSTVPNIWALPSGPIPPNPSELLNSDRMQGMLADLYEEFDIILMDTPPVLAAIDTKILSTLVDGVLFVVKAGKTTDKVFMRAVADLNKTRAKILGAILNEADVKHEDYYYTGYYRQQGDI